MVRSENGAAESTDNGPPVLAVEGDMAEPGCGLHISHAGTTAAPRACSRRWFASLHLPLLVYQKAEAHHLSFFFFFLPAGEFLR